MVLEMLDRLFNRHASSEPDPADALYDNIDEDTAREYDSGLVEFGLMTEDRFNSLYPKRPFVPERAVGTVALGDESRTNSSNAEE